MVSQRMRTMPAFSIRGRTKLAICLARMHSKWFIYLFPAQGSYHCFLPFLFFLLLLLPPPPPLLFAWVPLPGEGGSPCASNMPDCIAFCSHSKNSSSTPASMFGIPPLGPDVLPLPLTSFAKLAFTWKVGLWVFGGHLIPWRRKQKFVYQFINYFASLFA